MWANKNQTGFTIVETLIVLSITGLLFLMTMLLVRGQINNFQSKDAVTQLETALRTTLNDVSNGYYPDKGKLSCTLGLPVSASVDVAGGNVGTSTDCVYAGKSITFDTDKIVIKTLASRSLWSPMNFINHCKSHYTLTFVFNNRYRFKL